MGTMAKRVRELSAKGKRHTKKKEKRRRKTEKPTRFQSASSRLTDTEPELLSSETDDLYDVNSVTAAFEGRGGNARVSTIGPVGC